MFQSQAVSQEYSRIIQVSDSTTGLLAYISIHQLFPNTPSFGATRYAKYESSDQALADAKNLSTLMTYKSVMANLPYGGAKAVIVERDPRRKQAVLLEYAKFVNQLRNEFITGADIGVSQDDVKLMKTIARDNMVGTQLDPVEYTIRGMRLALDETVQIFFGEVSLHGLTFAIQGAGKIGEAFIASIYEQAGQVFLADIDQHRLELMKKKYPKIKIVKPNEIYGISADFFSPCAMSHSITEQTAPQLNCKVVLGGANIQLASATIGTLLHQRGILYVPDYVVNAGGLISVTDEYENRRASRRRTNKKLEIIPKRVREILLKSKKTGLPSSDIADRMANSLISLITSGGKADHD